MTRFVAAYGDPFEVGVTHGRALAARLRAFLGDGLTRLNRLLPEPTSLAELRPTLAAYDAQIASQTPNLHKEILGIAHGAGISRDEAVLLQVRREILGYQRIPTHGDCTTYARAGDVLAQTVDLNGELDDQLAVLAVNDHALVLSLGGLLGYLGINRSGLAVGLNLVLGGDWRPGLPPYLAIRHLLDTADSVATALDVLRGLRLASSRSLTLCDATTAVAVEVLGDELHVLPGPETAHTNHYLHPAFAPRDELNVFARNSSMLRLKAGQAAFESLPAGADAEAHFALLANPPICVADSGDIRRERTVAAVVMRPGTGRAVELHLRPGDPARSATEAFRL